MNTLVLTVPGISCGHCVHTIESELSEMPGINTVKADLETKQVTIVYVPPADEPAIRDLLSEINYPAYP